MGIAVAIIYIPLYLVISVVALLIGTWKQKSVDVSGWYVAIGAILAVISTLIFIWFVPVQGNIDWHAFFVQAAASLFGPMTVGCVLLAGASVAPEKVKNLFRCLALGSIYATLAMPWTTIFAGSHYHDVANYWSYNKLCRESEISYLVDVAPAKSALLQPDKLFSANPGKQVVSNTWAKFLLNQSLLESVEREPSTNSKFYGRFPIEELRINGGRVFKHEDGSKKSTEYLIRGVNKSTAEYIVVSRRLDLPGMNKKGIGGARIEIHRKSDKKLIAFAQYYWDNKTFKVCPDDAHQEIFVYRFIATALNVINPDSGIKGYEK